jgi:AcrR family transcriptional regulator
MSSEGDGSIEQSLTMSRRMPSGSGPEEGRPREVTVRAVLAATNELLDQNGFSAVTVEAIAARARVSKATIYRWWPNRSAVVMDAFLAATEPNIPFPNTGSIRKDLSEQMRRLTEMYTGKDGRTLAGLTAAAQSDPDLAEAYRSHWFAKRRAEAKTALERGIRRGELRGGLDLDIAADILYAPIYQRMLIGYAVLDDDFVNQLVDTALRGLAAPSDSPTHTNCDVGTAPDSCSSDAPTGVAVPE